MQLKGERIGESCNNCLKQGRFPVREIALRDITFRVCDACCIELIKALWPEGVEAVGLTRSILSFWAVDPDKSPNTILSTLVPSCDKALAIIEKR